MKPELPFILLQMSNGALTEQYSPAEHFFTALQTDQMGM